MAAPISLQRHFLSHRWWRRRAPCPRGLRGGHRLQWQRVPRAGGWRHSGNTSPAPRGWACRCSSSTSTSPQSSASSRCCGRPGCSAPSGPTSSPPALGRGTRAVRAGPPRHALVCQPHVCCAHWPRLQGRSLLWKTGSWQLNVCYPWAVSWTSGPGCDAHEQTPSLLGGLGDIGTGLDALAGDIEALSILTNALVVSQDHTMAFDETVVGCYVFVQQATGGVQDSQFRWGFSRINGLTPWDPGWRFGLGDDARTAMACGMLGPRASSRHYEDTSTAEWQAR